MHVGKQDAGVSVKMIQFQYDVARNLIYEMTIELTVWKDDLKLPRSYCTHQFKSMCNKVMCILYNYEILMSSFKGIRHHIVTVI